MKKFSWKPVLILWLFLGMHGLLLAQHQFTAVLDKQQIKIGEPARLTLRLTTTTQAAVLQWPKLDDSVGKLDLLESGKIDTQIQQGIQQIEQHFLLTGWDSAAFVIPSFLVKLEADGRPINLESSVIALDVSTVAVDTSAPIRAIKDIESVPSHWTDYLPLAGWVLGAAAIVGLLIYYFKRKKSQTISLPQKLEPYPQKYLRLLDELEGENLWQQDLVKEYYTRLSGILRGYLEERFLIAAREHTTAEINALARKNPAMRSYRTAIRDVLQMADMAKFAKARPGESVHVKALQEVRDFISQTQQLENNHIIDASSKK